MFIQKCDIGLSSQNPDGQYNTTSFPSKVLMYLSNGLSVVSIDIPVLRDSKVTKCIFYAKSKEGKDIAEALKYNEPHKAIVRHTEIDDRMKHPITDSLGRNQEIWFVNESGVYDLIFGSKLPSAKKFKRWVTSEVLPAIRKTGSYQLPMNPMEQIKMIAGGVIQMDERLTKLENTMTIDYAQQQSITKAVNKAVTKVLGGKQSNAYHEVGKKVFAECNRDIKDFFCVNARNNRR